MLKNKLEFIKEQSKDKYGSSNFYRFILLVIAYFYFVSGLFYYNIPTGEDPIPAGHRGFFIFLTIILFLISYLNDWLKKRIETTVYIVVYSVLAHLAYITYFNSFQHNLALALIGSMIIANLFFKGNQVLIYCNLALAVFVGLTLVMAENILLSFRLYFFAFYLTSALFTSIVSYQKFKSKEKLDNLNQEQKILLNNTDTQIWYLRDYDNYGKVNQAHADFLGYAKEEIENKKLAEILSYEEAQLCKESSKKVFKKKKKIESEIWLKNHRGEKRLLSIRKIPKINEQNEVEFVVCSAEDITAKKQKEEKLKLTQFSVDNAPLGIFWITPAGSFEYVNNKVSDILAYSAEELRNMKIFDIDINYQKSNRKKDWNNLKKKKTEVIESKVKTKDGQIIDVEITSRYLKHNNKEYELAFLKDISERKAREEEIKYLSYKDKLTDLYNRRFFEEELQRLDTKRQLPISIIMADVNGLKIINDSFGHDKGDEMLVKAAKLLENAVRKEDILARHGGDEFVVLLPQTKRKIAEKVLKRIKKASKKTENDRIPISLSFGLATKIKKSEDIKEILKKADDAMYQNKLLESKSAKNKIIQGLLNTLSVKSGETKEHALRMIDLAHDLGKDKGLPSSELDRLSLLAVLHDIGKATISEEILNKTGKLTDEEWEIIKKHPEIGSRIAVSTKEFALIAEEILSHHEKWDGSGYPRELEKEDIPYLARIIAITDAFDVMTNERPYSKAISKEKALAEIKKCSGTHFDPELAEAFIDMISGTQKEAK